MTHGSSFARDYLQWLTDNIREHPLENGWTEISTPFLDHFNDGIVIYAYNEGNAIILSDDGIVANNTIHVHDLRHSHASYLIHHGVPITTISRRLGHANANITLSVYSHMYVESENDVAQILNETYKKE